MDLSNLLPKVSLTKKVNQVGKEAKSKVTDLSFLEGAKPKYDISNPRKIVYCGCDRCKTERLHHIIDTTGRSKTTGKLVKVNVSVCKNCNFAYRVLL